MVHHPEHEEIIDYLIVYEKNGRRFLAEDDIRWGGLIEPAPFENPDKRPGGMRVAVFASWDYGYLVLETLKAIENKFPDKLNLVGLVTDDPLNPLARISLKKRVWSYLDLPERTVGETMIIESALTFGIPVYLGEIKTPSFHALLDKWKPDVILVCVFGQIIDEFTFQYPPFGIYNFHPSDLLKHQGAGPAPYEALYARKAETGLWSVHHITAALDGGLVIGQSPPVCVVDKDHKLPSNPLVVYHKLGEALSPLVYFLILELCGNFEGNQAGFIDKLNFPEQFPEDLRRKLMLPVNLETWDYAGSFPQFDLFNPL